MLPLLSVKAGHYEALTALAPYAHSYLEVGTYMGGSLRAVLQGNPRIGSVTCVDNWKKAAKEGKPAGSDHVHAMISDLGYKGAVHILDGDSAEILPTLRGHYDLTDVDALHTEDACYSDMRHVWPLTRVAMLVHDVWSHVGVRSALWRFLRELPTEAAWTTFCAGDHGTLVVVRAR